MLNLSGPSVFAQDGSGGDEVAFFGGGIIFVFYLAVLIGTVVGMWKTFEKAGKPGWGAIVPIYNLVLLLNIVGKPTWWVLLWLVPCVNVFVFLIVSLELAKCFGKSAGFGVGLFLLGPIFFPILGFGDAKYVAPQAA